MKMPEAIVIDGWAYVLIASFGAWAAALFSDEAAKYVAAWLLFWLRAGCASLSASLLALKMSRSTTYGDSQAKKNGNGNGNQATGTAAGSATTSK